MKTVGAKHIEAGWNSYRRMVVPADASEVQVNECRQAFYAGASILFENIMRLLSPGPEPMEADLQRMMDIRVEITEFGQQLDLRYLNTTGEH